MARIGELWRCESDGVLLEHCATDLCIQAVMQLRLALAAEPVGHRHSAEAGADDDDVVAAVDAFEMVTSCHAISSWP